MKRFLLACAAFVGGFFTSGPTPSGVTVGGPCGSPTIAPQAPHSEQGQVVK